MTIRYLSWLSISNDLSSVGKKLQSEFVDFVENSSHSGVCIDVNSNTEYYVREDNVYGNVLFSIQTKEFPANIIQNALAADNRHLHCYVTVCDLDRGTAVTTLHSLEKGNRYVDIARGKISSAFETILPCTGSVIDLRACLGFIQINN